VLEMMGLDSREVAAVRGAVIMGRDQAHDPEHLRRLKCADLGRTVLLTFDDVMSGLSSLHRDFERF